jgi:hypothetical protein
MDRDRFQMYQDHDLAQHCNQLFDEFYMMKEFCKDQIPKWFQQKSTSQEVWIDVFKHLDNTNDQHGTTGGICFFTCRNIL